tara:strand:- start:41 stop:295 length:255 start_codon:yes stop_codon:yes gene_type:complete
MYYGSNMDFSNVKIALVQGLVVLVPTYSVAFFTEKMVYTIPMLAAAGFIAASLRSDTTKRNVDDDGHKDGSHNDHSVHKDDGSS